jgi:uncharacterized protein (TIGR03435 family)
MKLAVAVCGLAGIMSVRGQVFEVASVKPGPTSGFSLPFRIGPDSLQIESRLKDLIMQAYEIEDYQVAGIPAWVQSERYAIRAKAAKASSPHEIRLMLQALLAERFRLKMHRETKTMAGYVLSVDKGGAKLPPPKTGVPADSMGVIQLGGGEIWGRATSMKNLARGLRLELERPVIDETKIAGNYDIRLRFEEGNAELADKDRPSDPTAGSIFAALHELGLRLDSRKVEIGVLVIDAAERPSGN